MTYLAVTFNPARDATYVLDRFVPGDVNRVIRQQVRPGGKGNNVACVLAAHGQIVRTTGFLAGHAGAFIDDELRSAGVESAFTWLESGESRTCHTLIERELGVISELLESGPLVSNSDGESFLAALPSRLEGIEVTVMSGSLPPGLTASFLARFMKIARHASPFLAIDSSGDGLRAAIAGGPDLIKPNEAELAALMGGTPTVSEMVRFVQDDVIGTVMPRDGQVLLSLAERGALLIEQTAVWHASPPVVDVVNTVGCGDALLAGYLQGRGRGLASPDTLALAVAFGTAAALSEVAGVVESADLVGIRPRVRLQRWTTDSLDDEIDVNLSDDGHPSRAQKGMLA